MRIFLTIPGLYPPAITNHITEMLSGAAADVQHQWQFPVIIDPLESVLYNSNCYSILPHQSIPICEILKCILPVLRTHQNLLSSSDNKTRIYTCDKTGGQCSINNIIFITPTQFL